MYKIICKEMTGENCDFVATADTADEAKKIFYAHGAEAETHRARYETATPEEKEAFGIALDEYLAKQG